MAELKKWPKYEMDETWIEVKFQFEGFHRWKDAPEEVAFLKQMHRHIFHVSCYISVTHDDRELEYFMVLKKIKTLILPFMELSEEVSSCEQKAAFICSGLINEYGVDRDYEVQVHEDGENGSLVVWRKKSYSA